MQTTLTAILDKVKPFWNDDAAPVFKDDDMKTIAALAQPEMQLLSVVRDGAQPLGRRFVAVEALAQGGYTKFRATAADSALVARVLAEAIPMDKIHNRWGLPGNFVGRTGSFLIALPSGVEAALAPLMTDNRKLAIAGSETATVNEMNGYRVSDLAAYLIAQHRGLQWKDSRDPAVRDIENARIAGAAAK